MSIWNKNMFSSPLCFTTWLEDPDEFCVLLELITAKNKISDPNTLRSFGIGDSHGIRMKWPEGNLLPLSHLSVVELRGDPGQSPLKVGEHELERFGPLLLRVELSFDGVRATAATRVLDLPFLHIHPEVWNNGQSLYICLDRTKQVEITCMGGRIQCLLSPPPL